MIENAPVSEAYFRLLNKRISTFFTTNGMLNREFDSASPDPISTFVGSAMQNYDLHNIGHWQRLN
jgi:hypothetical protein